MSLDITIFISVTFFSGKRKTPPCLTNENYFPYLLVKGNDEYLGICGIDGRNCTFDMMTHATILPINDGSSYSKLQENTAFFVMEGGKIVGEGVVDKIYQHRLVKK